MIITCVNCNKKFNVNSDLIPEDGRTIQCGSCNHVWFFKKDLKEKLEIQKKDETKTIENQLSGEKVWTMIGALADAKLTEFPDHDE